ncbi:MAG: hypothetical protein IJU16_04690 [Clostridia bacterium]|nr:hypothetical protein [Clostridia bacterium]
MRILKSTFALMLAAALLMSLLVSALPVAAEADLETGARWFPARMEINGGYDDMWEVVCGESMFQRFNEAETNEDAADAWLDTTYDANGALTITRNGKDEKEGVFWPKVRTLYLESMPSIDFEKTNLLYYDFTATENWAIDLIFNGSLELRLTKAICEAAGTATLASTADDGVAGTYRGSIDLNEAIAAIAADSADPFCTQAQALQSMKKLFLPQMNLFVVGNVGASMTVNKLYIASEADPEGEQCAYVALDLIYGETEEPGEEPADEEETETTASTTSAGEDKTPADTPDNGLPVWLIPCIVGVLVLATVVVIFVVPKKKAKNKQ